MNASLTAIHARAAAPRPLTPPPVPRFGSASLPATFRPDAYGGAWVTLGQVGYQAAKADIALALLREKERSGAITLELLPASPPRSVNPNPIAPCSP